MKPERIETLADGIFAIVMTLLVLELKVPGVHGGAHINEELVQGIAFLWPKFLTFGISFVILGIYWTSHHIMSAIVKRSDFNYNWLSIAFLLSISLIPFSTALLGEHPLQQTSLMFYGMNLITSGLLSYASFRYAGDTSRLTDEGRVGAELRLNATNKLLLPPALYASAVIMSFFNTKLSLVFFILGPAIYFIPVSSRLWNLLVDPHNRVLEHRPMPHHKKR